MQCPFARLSLDGYFADVQRSTPQIAAPSSPRPVRSLIVRITFSFIVILRGVRASSTASLVSPSNERDSTRCAVFIPFLAGITAISLLIDSYRNRRTLTRFLVRFALKPDDNSQTGFRRLQQAATCRFGCWQGKTSWAESDRQRLPGPRGPKRSCWPQREGTVNQRRHGVSRSRSDAHPNSPESPLMEAQARVFVSSFGARLPKYLAIPVADRARPQPARIETSGAASRSRLCCFWPR